MHQDRLGRDDHITIAQDFVKESATVNRVAASSLCAGPGATPANPAKRSTLSHLSPAPQHSADAWARTFRATPC